MPLHVNESRDSIWLWILVRLSGSGRRYSATAAHTSGWPRRREDGYDWQTCTECGQERRSPMQFRNDPPTAKAA